MKHLFLIISLMLAGAAAVSAQLPFERLKREKPDLEKIQKEITDRSSKYFYPALMKEYLSNDTAMTLDKYRRLYLGYMFQEDSPPSATIRSDRVSRFSARKFNNSRKTAPFLLSSPAGNTKASTENPVSFRLSRAA